MTIHLRAMASMFARGSAPAMLGAMAMCVAAMTTAVARAEDTRNSAPAYPIVFEMDEERANSYSNDFIGDTSLVAPNKL